MWRLSERNYEILLETITANRPYDLDKLGKSLGPITNLHDLEQEIREDADEAED